MEEWIVGDGWTDGQMDVIDNYALVCLHLCLVVMSAFTRQPRCNHIQIAGIAGSR